MARAYELLIGLTEVDTDSPFYRQHFPGFDGRRGCEGCAMDVKKMRELTHYLGYEPVTLEPLLNERATRARVLAMLEALASDGFGIEEEDIVFLYFSCHGRATGASPLTSLASFVGQDGDSGNTAYNLFLLHDYPILNAEIWTPFIQRSARLNTSLAKDSRQEDQQARSRLRLFTMVDACHAGLALRADEGLEPFKDEIRNSIQSKLAPLISSQNAEKSSLASLLATRFRQSAQIVHFGAARDELTALGDPKGSLFTRRFRQLFLNGGDQMSYTCFFEGLQQLLPEAHQPVMHPANGSPASANHFCHQNVLHI